MAQNSLFQLVFNFLFSKLRSGGAASAWPHRLGAGVAATGCFCVCLSYVCSLCGKRAYSNFACGNSRSRPNENSERIVAISAFGVILLAGSRSRDGACDMRSPQSLGPTASVDDAGHLRGGKFNLWWKTKGKIQTILKARFNIARRAARKLLKLLGGKFSFSCTSTGASKSGGPMPGNPPCQWGGPAGAAAY